MTRRVIGMVLILGQLTLALSGCLSVQATTTRPSQGPGGGVAAQVFADDGARRAGKLGPVGIMGELDREERDAWVPIFRSLNPAWTVAGLPPGSYRVRFPARLDGAGNVVRLSENTTEFRVQEGKITDVSAVLDHVDTALVVAGVVAAVLIAKYLHDHGLPEPPPPPPGLLDLVFYVSIDIVSGPGWTGVADRLPPAVTSHFPASDALVAARRPRVIFAFSEPLLPQALSPEGVSVLGEASGLVPGQVSYDTQNWWVVWQPTADLAPGDTLHVTLANDAVKDLAGNEPKAPTTFSFKTAK
jgi:uncharacterized protein YceK